jgi:CRISPR-associated protein Cmr2
VLQDLDSLGLFLGGKVALRNGTSFEVEPDSHARVSALLARVAGDQVAVATRVSDPLFGVPVYAGGDDVLMLAPAATAMRLARAIHDAIPADALPTASTAVFYFSQQGSLQQAIGRAHDLLKQAKALPDKHGLAVGYERRTGTTHHTVQPWDSPRGAGLGKVLAALSAEGAGSAQVSPRLVFDLQRDGDALASLAGAHESLLRAEMRRLVARHRRRSDNVVDVAPEEGQVATVESSTDHAFADLLVDLGLEEAEVTGKFDPVPAARVGLFLRQEAR